MSKREVYIVEYGGIYDGSGIEKVFNTYEDAETYLSQSLVTLNEDIKRRHGVALEEWERYKAEKKYGWDKPDMEKAFLGDPLEKKLFQQKEVDYYELCYSTKSTYIGISKYEVQ